MNGIPRAERARRAATRQASAIRRARGGRRLSKAEREQLWHEHLSRCHLCGLPVALELMQVEHVVAIANGGTDDWGNLRPSHRSCNATKGARTAPVRKGLRAGKPLRSKPRARVLPDDIF